MSRGNKTATTTANRSNQSGNNNKKSNSTNGINVNVANNFATSEEEHDCVSFFSEPSIASGEDLLSSSGTSLLSSSPAPIVATNLKQHGSPRNRLMQYNSNIIMAQTATKAKATATAAETTATINSYTNTHATSQQQQQQQQKQKHVHYAAATPGVYLQLPGFHLMNDDTNNVTMEEQEQTKTQQHQQQHHQQDKSTPIMKNRKHPNHPNTSFSSSPVPEIPNSASSNSDLSSCERKSSTTHDSNTSDHSFLSTSEEDANAMLQNHIHHHDHEKLFMDDFLDDHDPENDSDTSSCDDEFDDAKSSRTTSSSNEGVVRDEILGTTKATNNLQRSKPSQMDLHTMYAPTITAGTSNKNNNGDDADDKHAWFTCTKCGTRQREFFGVHSARNAGDSPVGYLVFYFLIYVISSLFIFGKEEGWTAVDCLYFSVITLTTTGFGDLHPTTYQAKLICSIFIYFGVACIGLLLGSSLATILDAEAHKEAKSQLEKSCNGCQRLRLLEENRDHCENNYPAASSVQEAGRSLKGQVAFFGRRFSDPEHDQINSNRTNSNLRRSSYGALNLDCGDTNSIHDNNNQGIDVPPLSALSSTSQNFFTDVEQEIKPLNPRDTIKKSHHTRHFSIDVSPDPKHIFSHALHHHHPHGVSAAESSSLLNKSTHNNEYYTSTSSLSFHSAPFVGNSTATTNMVQEQHPQQQHSLFFEQPSRSFENNSKSAFFQGNDETSSFGLSDDSVDSWENPLKRLDGFLATRHVFLTLKQAVMNSVLIIAIGSMGFHIIEGLCYVDAFYFTTVLLTTVGYGDITPQTDTGKIFATIYVLVAGTVLLHNMSLISMIPLEFRKRRIERSVLMQFGELLDDEALRELATGPLTQRLQLAANRSDGLAECTREMFSLAMLVRLGRITERDVKATFAAFRRLDRDNDGKLSSKDIICGEFIKRRRAKTRLTNSKNSAMLKNLGAQPSYGFDYENMAQYFDGRIIATTNAPSAGDGEHVAYSITPYQQQPSISENDQNHLDDDPYDDYSEDYNDDYEELENPVDYCSDHAVNYRSLSSNCTFSPTILPRCARSFGDYEDQIEPTPSTTSLTYLDL